VELTEKSIVLAVSQPDLQRNSVGVKVAGRGTRIGIGQDYLLAPYGGGGCKFTALEVKADAVDFLLKC
jgi:hypothetical protein